MRYLCNGPGVHIFLPDDTDNVALLWEPYNGTFRFAMKPFEARGTSTSVVNPRYEYAATLKDAKRLAAEFFAATSGDDDEWE